MAKKVRILSLDGGGMRGIIPAVVLKYVEEQIQKISGDNNKRIADCFDMVVGTSTGGILGCFYLTPNLRRDKGESRSKYTAHQALEFYVTKGYQIFNASKKSEWFGLRQLVDATRYNAASIEKIFQEEFGTLRLSQLLGPCILTTYDLKQKAAFFFNSREATKKRRDFFVRDAVRSTSAAPTYFSPAIISNILTGEEMINVDGGVFANNPTMCAYAEARHSVFPQCARPTAGDMFILSIGTGGGQVMLPDTKNIRDWGVIKWAKSIPEIMMDGSIDTVNYQLMNLYRAIGKEFQRNYKRIDVPMEHRTYSNDMADASSENIQRLINAGIMALQLAGKASETEYSIDQFIQKLWENDPDNPE